MSFDERLITSPMGKIRLSSLAVKKEDLPVLFRNALVWDNDSTIVIESLTNQSGEHLEKACPRDVEKASLIKNSQVYKGWDICQFCENCLSCATDGRTKQFKLFNSNSDLVFEATKEN